MKHSIHSNAGGKVRTPLLCLGILAMLPLASCENHSKDHFTVGSINGSYKSRHPIIIDEKEQTLDIPISRTHKGLAYPQISAIENFAAQFHKSATRSITIMRPTGSQNQATARQMARKVSAILSKAGIARHRQRFVSYNANQHGALAPVRLSYITTQASVSGCGQWPKDLAGLNGENRNYHNFGCATQNNLAAQLANPADLLHPRGSTAIDAARRNKVIEDYRSGDNTLSTPASAIFSSE